MSKERELMLKTINPGGGTQLPENIVQTLSEKKLVHVVIMIYSLPSDKDVRRLRLHFLLEPRTVLAEIGPHAKTTL